MTLELTDVSTSYDGFTFGPVSLTVGPEVLSVLGPSGGGKTTLLSVIAGIVRPDSGTVSLDGRSLVGRALEERRVGMVFQDGALFPHMTARENVAYAAAGPETVESYASMLEIEDVLERHPAALSGGEQQRVALARTLAAEPSVLLLDEPLSSLDAPIRRRLRDQLYELFRSLEIPVVYVTHDQRTATVLGDRLAILRDGRLEQIGPPDAVLTRPATPFVARFTGSENVFEATVRARDGEWAALEVGAVSLRARTDRPDGAQVTACIRPSQLRIRAADGPTATENTLTGTVRRRLNEGDNYRLVIEVDDADLTLVAQVRATAVGWDGTQPDAVDVALPAETIHVLPDEG